MNKLRVNISTPGNWDFENYLRLHSPGQAMAWDEFQFFHNQSSGEFDFWIVLDQLECTTTLKVTDGNIFLVTTEEVDVVPHYIEKYLNQFHHIITTRQDISHAHVIRTHYFTHWQIKKNYDELKLSLADIPSKSKLLSAIISCRVQYGQQKKRYGFINKLKGHFKHELDWFSREENPIENKISGLELYQYSIAIENSAHHNYFTEKLVDVILCETIPFYWGAPNIYEYFPRDLIKLIPLDSFENSINIIEETISSNTYKDLIPLLKDYKLKILDEYQFFPWLANLLRQNASGSTRQSKIRIIREKDLDVKARLKKILVQNFFK